MVFDFWNDTYCPEIQMHPKILGADTKHRIIATSVAVWIKMDK